MGGCCCGVPLGLGGAWGPESRPELSQGVRPPGAQDLGLPAHSPLTPLEVCLGTPASQRPNPCLLTAAPFPPARNCLLFEGVGEQTPYGNVFLALGCPGGAPRPAAGLAARSPPRLPLPPAPRSRLAIHPHSGWLWVSNKTNTARPGFRAPHSRWKPPGLPAQPACRWCPPGGLAR